MAHRLTLTSLIGYATCCTRSSKLTEEGIGVVPYSATSNKVHYLLYYKISNGLDAGWFYSYNPVAFLDLIKD